MTSQTDFFGPRQIAAAAPKPTVSSRLQSLLCRVTDLVRADQQSKVETYSELVAMAAASEIGDGGTLPSADEVLAICQAAGKTIDDLQTDVAREVEARSLLAELAAEPDAVESLKEIEKRLVEHSASFERTMASLTATGDQLQAERRACQRSVTDFASKRNRLVSIAGVESPRESEIRQHLRGLMKSEVNLQVQSGRPKLAEKFIVGTIENDPEVIELAEINAALLADKPPRKLFERQTELSRSIESSKRLYELGARVRQIREQKAELTKELETVKAERLASVVNDA